MRYFLILSVFVIASFRVDAQVSILAHQANEYSVNPASLVSVTVLNSEGFDIRAKVLSEVSNDQGKVIVRVISNKVVIAPGTHSISNQGIENVQYSEGTNSIKDSGILPFGKYQICVKIVVEGGELMDELCDGVESDYTEFISLIFPAEGDSVPSPNPFLTWTHTGDFLKSNEEFGYRLVVTKMEVGQSASSALLNNRPVFSECCLRSHQTLYPNSATKLESGQKYAWQVERIDRGRVVQTSDAWWFYVPHPEVEKDLKYVIIHKTSNTDVVPVFDKLFFRFDEPYSSGALRFNILNENRQKMTLQVTNDERPSDTIEPTKSVGYNTYELNIAQFGLEPGYYVVQIFNEKGERFELKIKVG